MRRLTLRKCHGLEFACTAGIMTALARVRITLAMINESSGRELLGGRSVRCRRGGELIALHDRHSPSDDVAERCGGSEAARGATDRICVSTEASAVLVQSQQLSFVSVRSMIWLQLASSLWREPLDILMIPLVAHGTTISQWPTLRSVNAR